MFNLWQILSSHWDTLFFAKLKSTKTLGPRSLKSQNNVKIMQGSSFMKIFNSYVHIFHWKVVYKKAVLSCSKVMNVRY